MEFLGGGWPIAIHYSITPKLQTQLIVENGVLNKLLAVNFRFFLPNIRVHCLHIIILIDLIDQLVDIDHLLFGKFYWRSWKSL